MLKALHTLFLLGTLTVVTLALHLPKLDIRPLHGDEANQMVRTDELVRTGHYSYDPHDHHGPILYYCTAPIVRAFAGPQGQHAEIWMYRIVPVLFALFTVLLINGLGIWKKNGTFASHRGVFIAGLFLATSPVMTFYSRYFIQETLLIFFLLGMGVALRYYAYWPSWRSAFMFGLCGGCALACKETALLAFAAFAIAGWWAFGVHRIYLYWRTKHVLIALLALIATALIWFTSFGTNPGALGQIFTHSISAYGARAVHADHSHPWWWYARTLLYHKYGNGPIWSEALLLIPAALGIYDGFRKGGVRALRFLTIYAVVLAAIYCAIPYKTPWCVLSFWAPIILLAGAGCGTAWQLMRKTQYCKLWRGLLIAAIAGILYHQVLQTYRACYQFPANRERNPYVYAHTSIDALNLVDYIRKSADPADPVAFAVPTPDVWPMPWYLRNYTNTGYWTALKDIPLAARPRLLILPADEATPIPEQFGTVTDSRLFGIRPGVLLTVYIFQQADSP